MKKQKTQNLRSTNKGITLIALVITIIVMLILVAVTITMAVNGGLFDYASKAGREMNDTAKLEQELGSGRVKVGNTWYDSPQDLADGKPSANQGEEAEEEEEPEEEVTSISVAETLEVKHTEEAQLTVSVVPNVNIEGITYNSSNPAVVAVDNTGKVTGLAVGTSTITVTYKELSDICTVTVKPKVSSITISGVPYGLEGGMEFQLSVTTAPSAVNSGFEYESDNTAVAEVSSTGYVTLYKGGNARITVRYGEISNYVDLDVSSREGYEPDVPEEPI